MSTQMQSPDSIAWETVWRDHGMEPTEEIDSVQQIAFALSLYVDGIESEEEGVAITTEALKNDVLTRTTGGSITIAGVEQPEDDRVDQDTNVGEKDAPEEMDRSELEQEVTDLRKEVNDMAGHMNAMNARLNELTKALVGDETLSAVVDPDHMENVWSRLDELSDDVQEHEDKLHMFSKGGGKKKSPDERAQTLRSVLYKKAKSDSSKVGKMTRDECDTALGGGMTRYKLIEAMRRAANGDEGDINGSSDLENLDGVEVIIGSGRDEQSKIRMDIQKATATQLRRIPTTEREGNGGQ